MKKHNNIKFLIIFLLVVLLITIILILTLKKEDNTWNKYINEYKDKTIDVLGDNNYSNKFILKDKTLYTEDNIEIFNDVMNIYSIKYNDDYYIYIVCIDGKTYYLNNLKDSIQDEYELTELGDYKELIDIKTNNEDIIGTDLNGNEYILTNNIESYIN